MKSEFQNIGKLREILNAHVKRVFLSKLVSFLLLNLAIVFSLYGIFGFVSSKFPLNTLYLKILIYTKWILVIGIPAALIIWKSTQNQILDFARRFDRHNPQIYEGFQTLFSLSNHGTETLTQLNSLYGKGLKKLKPIASKKFPLGIAGVFITSLLFVITAGILTGNSSEYVNRVIRPKMVLDSLPLLKINIETTRKKIGKGDTVTINGSFENLVKGQNVFAHLIEEGVEKRYALKIENHKSVFTVGPAKNDFSVFFKAENGKSSTLRVEVVDKPYVTSVTTVKKPPEYTKLHLDTLPSGQQQFSVLNGTQVTWNLTTSRPIQGFKWIEPGSNSNVENEITATSDISFKRLFNKYSKDSVEKVIRKYPYPYGIRIKDKFGIYSDPITLGRVSEHPDGEPLIKILNPLNGDLIPQSKKISLHYEVEEDFGLSVLQLRYKVMSDGLVKDSVKKNIFKSYTHGKREGVYHWDLTKASLFPDNVVSFYLLACDNNKVKGYQCTSSEKMEIRFPSIREMMAEVEKKEQSSIQSLRGALSKQQLLQKKLERVKASDEHPRDYRSQFEVRKILSSDPKRMLRHGKNILKLHKNKLKSSPKEKNSLEKSLNKFEKAIPENQVDRKSPKEQLKVLNKLNKEEKKLLSKLEKMEKKFSKKNSFRPIKNRLNRLKSDLQNNLSRQEELKEFLKSKAQEKKFEQNLKKEAAEGQQKIMQEVDEALKNVKDLMKESFEKGVFNDSLMEKLEKIQDLLSEILPDSLRDMLQKKMSGEKMDPQSLEQGLKNILDNQEMFEENINQALRMLENLKRQQRIEAFKKSISDMAQNQKSLNKKMEGKISKGGAKKNQNEQNHQARLKNEFSKINKDLQKESFLKYAKPLDSMVQQKSVEKQMKKSEQEMKKQSQSGMKKALKAGQNAQKQMQQMAGMLNAMGMQMQGMQNQMDMAQLKKLTEESLQLSQLQILAKNSESERVNRGWDRTPASLYGSGFKVARWIYQTLTRMSEKSPFISRYMRMQAQQLAAELDALSKEYNPSRALKSMEYNQNLTRELLKLMKQAQQGGGGGGSGQASGSQNPQQGMGNLSNQLKGMSGKQLSVNSATRQLLRSMLNARRQGRSGQPQGQTGRQQGGQGSQGQSGKQGQRGQQSGEGNSGSSLGQRANELANQQGRLGDQLENMAENAPGDESVSGKLRRLAKEARELEKQLRGGVNRQLVERQNQFKSRLLETVKSLKKKGYSSKRKSKSSSISWGSSKAEQIEKSKWVKQIEREMKKIQKMNLEKKEKQELENYFKSLLIQ